MELFSALFRNQAVKTEMKIVVAISGASGVIIGFRLIQELHSRGFEIYCVVTQHAEDVIQHELGSHFKKPQGIRYFKETDQSSPLNSSSFIIDAMIVAPCSMKTLAAIAAGYTNSLVIRCAENALRTGAKLILVPRETPLSEAALSNMLTLNRAGAMILPPSVAYYPLPKTLDDVTNFFVGKIMDLLRIPNDLYARWVDHNES